MKTLKPCKCYDTIREGKLNEETKDSRRERRRGDSASDRNMRSDELLAGFSEKERTSEERRRRESRGHACVFRRVSKEYK